MDIFSSSFALPSPYPTIVPAPTRAKSDIWSRPKQTIIEKPNGNTGSHYTGAIVAIVMSVGIFLTMLCVLLLYISQRRSHRRCSGGRDDRAGVAEIGCSTRERVIAEITRGVDPQPVVPGHDQERDIGVYRPREKPRRGEEDLPMYTEAENEGQPPGYGFRTV